MLTLHYSYPVKHSFGIPFLSNTYDESIADSTSVVPNNRALILDLICSYVGLPVKSTPLLDKGTSHALESYTAQPQLSLMNIHVLPIMQDGFFHLRATPFQQNMLTIASFSAARVALSSAARSHKTTEKMQPATLNKPSLCQHPDWGGVDYAGTKKHNPTDSSVRISPIPRSFLPPPQYSRDR